MTENQNWLDTFRAAFVLEEDESSFELETSRFGNEAKSRIEIRETLLLALKDNNPYVRRAAICALMFVAKEPGVLEAIQELLVDKNTLVRVEAYRAFLYQKTFVRQNYRSFYLGTVDEDRKVRLLAVMILRYVVNLAKVERMLKQTILTVTEEEKVRAAALISLSTNMSKRTIFNFVGRFLDHDCETLRQTAYDCFARVATRSAVNVKFLKLLDSSDKDVRKKAVELLANATNLEKVRRALIDALYDLEDSIRGSAAMSLAKYAHRPEVQRELINILRLTPPDERIPFLKALSKGIASTEVQQAFYDTILTASSQDVQKTAMMIMRNRSADPVVKNALKYVQMNGGEQLQLLAIVSRNYQEKRISVENG